MSTTRFSHPTKSCAPAWTFSKKQIKDKTLLSIPGPGTYDNQPLGKQNAKSFAHSSRDNIVVDHVQDTPGPGAYKQFMTFDAGPSYSMKKQPTDQKLFATFDTPGPGSYNPRQANRKDSHTIGRKRSTSEELKDLDIPGPGSYEAKIPTRLNRSYAFRKTKKQFQYETEAPGPGTYEMLPFNSIQAPSYEFSVATKSSTLDKAKSISPGPGAYDFWDDPSPKGWTIRPFKKPLRFQTESQVGPGYYDTDEKSEFQASAFTMGRSKRFLKDGSTSPGPGSYKPRQSKSTGRAPAFGTTLRNDNFTKQQKVPVPGPGYYPEPEHKNQKNMFEFRGRATVRPIPLSPGPGHYDMNKQDRIRLRAPACLMKKSFDRKDYIREVSPGPGAYVSYKKQKPAGPAYTFGKSPNDTRVEPDNRTEYNIPSTFPNISPYQITKNMMKSIS